MRSLRLLTSLAPLLFAAACGDSAGKSVATLLDDASTSLQAEDWKTALVSLDAALADSKATAEEKTQAWMDKITAESCGNGDDAGKGAVQKMVAAGVSLTAEQFASRGLSLADAGHGKVSIDLLKVATEKFGADPVVHKRLKRVAKKCAASGDADDLASLKALGYLSSDTDDEDEEAAAGGNN